MPGTKWVPVREAPFLYRFVQRLFYVIAHVMAHVHITGLENARVTGPLIVAPNHLHMFDVALTFIWIPRQVTVFAADKWRGTPFGLLMSAVANAIYVARGEVDRHALAEAVAVLKAGGALGMAPEGTRSRTGGLIEGKNGVAYIASRSGATILPMVVWGHEKAFKCWKQFRRPHIYIHIAEPYRLPPESERARTRDLAVYTDELMLTLARMLPEEYRGVYSMRTSAREG